MAAQPESVDDRPLHIVQIGWDTALMEADAPSDARERQLLYARLLAERRPASRMTIVVLGASVSARSMSVANLNVEPLPGRWRGIAKLPKLLARLHSECPVSVVAPQSPMEEGWAALYFARPHVPVVAQVHFDMLSDAALPQGSISRRLIGRARRDIALRLLSRYTAIRTVAPEMAARLRTLGAGGARSIPVPILDLEALLRIADAERPPRVLFVGRLAPEKNLPLWLEAARRIAAEQPSVRFDIVGGGAQQPALAQLAADLGLADLVTWHGPKPRGALPEIYAKSSILMLTSDHEGFGRVLVEALAAGTAVVATATAGAREVISDGETGLLTPVGDAAALSSAVVRLLRDAPLRRGMIAAGRRRVSERYQPEVLAGQWVDMLIEATRSVTRETDR